MSCTISNLCIRYYSLWYSLALVILNFSVLDLFSLGIHSLWLLWTVFELFISLVHTYIHTYIRMEKLWLVFSERTLLRCSLLAFWASRRAASLWELIIQFLINSKQGGCCGMGGTFQAFLWIMNLPYATHTALLGNLLDCSIRLEFRLHCYLSLQLFLDCLQQQLEVSKNNYILFILCLEMSSQDVSWGFTLEHSILIRIPRMFLFCFANLIFILGYCSTGCFKGNT